jgi:hypothetical protein
VSIFGQSEDKGRCRRAGLLPFPSPHSRFGVGWRMAEWEVMVPPWWSRDHIFAIALAMAVLLPILVLLVFLFLY